MAVRITPVTGKRDLKRFIYLPEKLHQNDALWLPPIYKDEWEYFDPGKNLAFRYCDSTAALAWRDERLVGRVLGIVNNRHNEHTKESTARFALLESTDDQEVAHGLLSHVEEWARAKGMTRIIGPFGFTDQDAEGFLIEGFEQRPTIVTYYNFPYIPRLVEAEGYVKEVDKVVYKVPRPKDVPELMAKLSERAERRGYREVGLKSIREAKRYIRPVLGLMNEAYVGVYGYSALDDEEMHQLANKYLAFLDPRFLRVAVKDEQVVGFMIAMPDLWEGIVKSRGRLFPFGFIHILLALKRRKIPQMNLLLAGIKEEHRGKGLDMLMGREMLKASIAVGVEFYDSHLELETNTLVRAEMERQGGVVYKKYRIYQKNL